MDFVGIQLFSYALDSCSFRIQYFFEFVAFPISYFDCVLGALNLRTVGFEFGGRAEIVHPLLLCIVRIDLFKNGEVRGG